MRLTLVLVTHEHLLGRTIYDIPYSNTAIVRGRYDGAAVHGHGSDSIGMTDRHVEEIRIPLWRDPDRNL